MTVATLALSGFSGAAAANILLNPGFEIGSDADATDWLETSGPSGSTTRSSAMPNNGGFSAYMTADHINNPAAPTPYSVEQTQPVGSIDHTVNYNLSFSAKVDSLDFTGFDMFYQILWLDQDASDGGGVKGEILTSLVTAGVNTVYQSFGLSDLDVPDGADSFQLRFQLSPGAVEDIVNGLYVDDVDLSPTTAGLAGDFNFDNKVDGSDLLVWQRLDGAAASLNAWQSNYGSSIASIAGYSSVPEPATYSFSLMLASCFFGLRRMRRRY